MDKRSRPDVPADMTLFMILAEYGTAQIPVERCAAAFGMTADEAKRAAKRQALPVPSYRLGSQKSPWLVDARALAEHVRSKSAAAHAEWKRIHAA
jgi:hypothetical protein